MLERVISGGQTGADQAGLRAARLAGIPTGGWAPQGWATEDGPAPWLADFGQVECDAPGDPARTRMNALHSDGTVWFGSVETAGFKSTDLMCRGIGRPMLIVRPGREVRPSDVASWVRDQRISILNVAGNRESKNPGIGEKVERFLAAVFRALGEAADPSPGTPPD